MSTAEGLSALLSKFCAETSEQPPCGPDLSYDPAFMALENALETVNDQTKWHPIEQDAQALLVRSKDVRVAVWLCRAWVHQHGLPGMASGLQLIARLLERYWVEVHPQAEAGDDYFMRMNALGGLNDKIGLLRTLRDTPFLRTAQLGEVSVREAQATLSGTPLSNEKAWSIDELRLAVMEERERLKSIAGPSQDDLTPSGGLERSNRSGGTDNQEVLTAVEHAHTALAEIQKTCAQFLPNDQTPQLKDLQRLLHMLHELVQTPAVADGGAAPSLAEETPGELSGAAVPGAGNVNQAYAPPSTREQATSQLRHIAQVLDRVEPTNPAQLLIERAAKLMNMRFMDIVCELELTHLKQFENITGLRREPPPEPASNAETSDTAAPNRPKHTKTQPSSKPLGSSNSSTITYNREEVLTRLLHIATFLEEAEPTNPASLLVRRAVKLMRMSFIDVVRELSPESVGQVEIITGHSAGASLSASLGDAPQEDA